MYTSKGCRVNKFMHYFLFGHIQLKFALGLQTWNYKGLVRLIGKESQVYRSDSKVHSPSHQFLPKHPVSCHLFESPHEFVLCFGLVVRYVGCPQKQQTLSNRVVQSDLKRHGPNHQVRKLKIMFFTFHTRTTLSQRLFQSSKWESLSTQALDLFADCWNPNWWGVFVSPTRLDTSKSISPHVVWTRSCLWNRRAGSRAPCRSYNWLRSVLEKDDQVDDLKTPTDHQQTLRFSSTRVWKFSWKSCPHVTRSL